MTEQEPKTEKHVDTHRAIRQFERFMMGINPSFNINAAREDHMTPEEYLERPWPGRVGLSGATHIATIVTNLETGEQRIIRHKTRNKKPSK